MLKTLYCTYCSFKREEKENCHFILLSYLLHEWYLKGSLTRFSFNFFPRICVHWAPELPIRTVSKIRGDIREGIFIRGVNDTGDKREKF